ncbi:MAG: beta-N-acetylhexosaminidase [Armatimonadota bacterium]
MTLEQKIGAMLVFGWAGEGATGVNAHAREIVNEMQVGGVVLLGRNVADNLAETAETLNELQSMSREPLFVIADQEGGMVARFVDGVTVFPSNMAVGATGSPDLAREAAAATARELCAIGCNFNFAPCVDVNNNPDNPIIGTRSYGESPEKVAELAACAIRGYQENGMIACAKHFPGHGDTAVDSHLALPSVPYARERLDRVELTPFRAAIAAGVSSIMTAHIMFPALDADRPSTLSRRIISGLLREELGYEGVVVTDCMEMKAIADNFGTPEAAVMAVEAGVDMVLVCHTLSTQRETLEALIKAVKDGRINESRIEKSVARIAALKRQYSLEERRRVDPEALAGILRHPNHLELQRTIAERAVTLVRNKDKAVPLNLRPDKRVMVIGLHPTVAPLYVAVREHHENAGLLRLEGIEPEAAVNSALEAAAAAEAIIVPTCPKEPWRAPVDQNLQTRVVRSLAGLKKKLIVVAVREPYDLSRFPEVRTYVCIYGYRGGTIEAAAKLIFGKIQPQGIPPVTIPERSHAQDGEDIQGEVPQYF